MELLTEKIMGKTKRPGGANEALLDKNPKTTHLEKVSCQIIQTFQILSKCKDMSFSGSHVFRL